jgi:hypothetical protein
MDLAYHIQVFLHDLTRSISDDAEVMLIAFLGCAVLVYRILSRSKRSSR